jgi:hypothetical protein
VSSQNDVGLRSGEGGGGRETAATAMSSAFFRAVRSSFYLYVAFYFFPSHLYCFWFCIPVAL